jgi:hypothetical protein
MKNTKKSVLRLQKKAIKLEKEIRVQQEIIFQFREQIKSMAFFMGTPIHEFSAAKEFWWSKNESLAEAVKNIKWRCDLEGNIVEKEK